MIKISGTKAIDCGTVYDVPADAKIEISDTVAVRTNTVLKVRDAEIALEKKLLELVEDGTPIEDVRQLISSLLRLQTRSQDTVIQKVYENGFQRFIKPIVGLTSFAGTVVGLLNDLNIPIL